MGSLHKVTDSRFEEFLRLLDDKHFEFEDPIRGVAQYAYQCGYAQGLKDGIDAAEASRPEPTLGAP